MRVSEIFAMGGGCGHGDERHRRSYSRYSYGGFHGGRFSYGYYNGYNRGGFNGGLRNRSASRGEGLLGILG